MGQKYSKKEIEQIKINLEKDFGQLIDPIHYDKIPEPTEIDWLSNHYEPGQTIDKYLNCRYSKPDSERNIIYIVSTDSNNVLLEYIEIFFQMQVILLEYCIDFTIVKKVNNKYLTNDILKQLEKILPPDAFCLMALTDQDLYSKGCEFVFGEASYYDRVGIFSFARFDPNFYKDIDKQDIIHFKDNYSIDLISAIWNDSLLSRSLKIVTHEILHMFSIKHCVFYNCLMCGSNSFIELDKWSRKLCPICIQKLYIAHPFNITLRQSQLETFCNRHGLRI